MKKWLDRAFYISLTILATILVVDGIWSGFHGNDDRAVHVITLGVLFATYAEVIEIKKEVGK